MKNGAYNSIKWGPLKNGKCSYVIFSRNSCYGVEGSVLGDGVFDVTTCQFNAPIGKLVAL